MEVLSVNQFNGQFTFGNGVKGGWSTTAPPTPEDTPLSPADLLARDLARELRAAKHEHLACSEVLLPSDLLRRVASDILRLSDTEPCGVRGSTVYVEFEPSCTKERDSKSGAQGRERDGKRVIAAFKPDQSTVSTFELYLTLRQENGWTDRLPQFLKNLTRGSTVIISADYTLSKTLLYRSYRDS